MDIAPALKEILISSEPVDIKRSKITSFLADLHAATFYHDHTVPPLEWILARDAIRIFRTLIWPRSEILAGYSFLKYLDDLLHAENFREIEKPKPDFFC